MIFVKPGAKKKLNKSFHSRKIHVLNTIIVLTQSYLDYIIQMEQFQASSESLHWFSLRGMAQPLYRQIRFISEENKGDRQQAAE